MSKKKSRRFVNLTEDDDLDYHVKFRPTIVDNNYCLSRISTANPAWKKLSIERDKNKIDIIYDGKRIPYRHCKTYKECERQYDSILENMNELLYSTYDDEDRDYAEFVFETKIKNDRAYVVNFMKFFYIA